MRKGAAAAGVFVAMTLTALAMGATERRIAGIITAVDASSVTIQGKVAATGKVDEQKTRITIDGRAAKASELRVTEAARGELALDDVWLSIAATTR